MMRSHNSFMALLCFIAVSTTAQSQEWYTYRHDAQRTGLQSTTSALSNPANVANLQCAWSFPPDGVCGNTPKQSAKGAFYSSPIVVNGTVFAGSQDGHLYALEATSGAQKWQYPPSGQAALLGSCADFGAYGIGSSASFTQIGGQNAIIFAAPDPSADGGLGSARLFALFADGPNAGNPIWHNDGSNGSVVVARVTDCTPVTGNPPAGYKQFHERVAWSSPLILGNNVYVGVHDAGDNPLQQGHIEVVDLSSGNLVSVPFVSTGKTLDDGTRGGGVWNSLATDGTYVYFTTGNTQPSPYCQPPYGPNNCPLQTPPTPNNYGLGMIEVDSNGNFKWAYRPVDFFHDGDPDWAAGAAVMSTSCGELIASVQKDGWSYALNPSGALQWQFPPTIQEFGDSAFLAAPHGADGYRSPGAAWNNVFIVRTGGENLVSDGVAANWGNLIALNACATTERQRVQWISIVPNNSGGGKALAAPTVTDSGIVFIGTDQGHLVVLGNPSVSGQAGEICSNPDYSTVVPPPPVPCPPPIKCPLPEIVTPRPSPCVQAGFSAVPIPWVLFDAQVPDGGDLADLHKEVVLAEGGVFVSTKNGHVYMYQPKP
jgi:outer membrane protein assembly factor BamB